MVKPLASDQHGQIDGDAVSVNARLEVLISALRTAPQATEILAALAVERGWNHKVRARKLSTATLAAPASVASLLDLGGDEPTGYRAVELVCGQRVLSRAENWFVPSRLSAGINARLADTDEPFGLLIAGLQPRRETLDLVRLWTSGAMPVSGELFRLNAVVSALAPAGRRPLAIVTETYLADALA